MKHPGLSSQSRFRWCLKFTWRQRCKKLKKLIIRWRLKITYSQSLLGFSRNMSLMILQKRRKNQNTNLDFQNSEFNAANRPQNEYLKIIYFHVVRKGWFIKSLARGLMLLWCERHFKMKSFAFSLRSGGIRGSSCLSNLDFSSSKPFTPHHGCFPVTISSMVHPRAQISLLLP